MDSVLVFDVLVMNLDCDKLLRRLIGAGVFDGSSRISAHVMEEVNNILLLCTIYELKNQFSVAISNNKNAAITSRLFMPS